MLQITTLVENSAGEHKALVHEHGLCFFIDNGGNRLLFDTGQSDALVRNAARLRIDLTTARHVVLSHGHYDHSGGLRPLAAVASGFEVVTGRGFFDEKFGELGAAHEFLGNDFDARWLADNGIAHGTLNEPTRELAPGVYALTDFPRTHPDEVVNPRFKLRSTASSSRYLRRRGDAGGGHPQGTVVVLGCSHPGAKNMLAAATQRLGRPIHAVIGGPTSSRRHPRASPSPSTT